jgi:hypothetical protein
MVSVERRFLIDDTDGFLLPVQGSVMTFPVSIHPSNGQFEATLVGAPEVPLCEVGDQPTSFANGAQFAPTCMVETTPSPI